MDYGVGFELCPPARNHSIFANLTKSYNQQLHDASTMSASFIMFALTAVFFILNLFSHLSDVSAILDPKIRVGLTSALSLFLSVMTYLFSEAKNKGGPDHNSKTDELPQRARFILIWMLLIELLRKKVEEIHMQGYSGTIERAGRVLWLGSLVFSNLQATGRKAMTGILWMLCASKLVQRISFTEFGKRSLAFGKNARLISSYMEAHVLGRDGDQCLRPGGTTEDNPLRRCKYAVMDEDKLVVEPIPNGFRFKDDVSDVATVGKIWELAETDLVLSSLDRDGRLRRLCLSLALFKLLRRRFEHLPAPTAAETRSYRQIIFRGLHEHNKHTLSSSEQVSLFDVTSDELDFMCEYYHSVLPVALASPFFLLANYFLVPIVVFVMCLVLIVVLGNGDVIFAFHSMREDNSFTFFGVMQMAKCLPQVFKSPIVFFCIVDFAITFLLFILFIYEEVWEFLVFLLSDWFLVSLICKYVTDPLRRNSQRTFSWTVHCILLVRRLMHRPSISFNQFSVLNFCGVTVPAHIPLKSQILLRPIPVSKQVKNSITSYLTNKLYDHDGNERMDATLSNGTRALVTISAQSDRPSTSASTQTTNHPFADLSPFCSCDSVAEVILTWHIATCMLEVKHPHQSDSSKVATTLSKYCAYLVAFHPELLPDNQDSVNRVFKAIKLELFQLLGFCGYYLSLCSSIRYHKIESCSEPAETEAAVAATKTVVVRGATLASKLASKVVLYSKEDVWNVLADLWVELLVYITPSTDEQSVGAHADVLSKGGEFITVLWAIATHAGISRPDDAVPTYHAEGTDA